MCAKKTKKGKDRLDKYYHLAKEQGYRSRAAFKLIQLNKKYNFLQNANSIVDLCAAPGGWLQVARKFMPVTGTLYGVDLASIKKIPNVTTLEADITSKKTLKRILMDMNNIKVDVVLHDGAPNVGSNWLKDAYGQAELVLHSARMACALLKPNGVFVTKVFRSKDYHSLLWVLNQLFNKVEAAKPKASRNASAEIFCVCEGFKAPKEIDPKLFDPAFVFEETIANDKKILRLSHRDLIKQQKKPNREGYEDEAYILYKEYPISEFVKTEHPINVCVENNTLIWDEAAQIYLNHPATTEDIKIYCKDLKVLGRLDFKDLLKWRERMNEYREELEQNVADKMQDEDGEAEDEDVEIEEQKPIHAKDIPLPASEEQAAKELESLRLRVERMKKNLIKRKKVKDAKRMPTPFDLTEDKDDIMDNIEDAKLFSLTKIADREHLEKLRGSTINSTYDDSDDEESGAEDEDVDDADYIDLNKYDLDDEDQLNEILERQLDAMYDLYAAARSKKAAALAETRKDVRERERLELAQALATDKKGTSALSSEDIKKKTNPLLVDYEEGNASRKVGQWFSQNIFDVLNEDEESDDDDAGPAKKKRRVEFSDDVAVSDDEDDEDDEDEAMTANQQAVISKDGFETVPQEMLDPEVHATTLATAKKLLRKKNRRDFIDNAFNRYAFNDTDLAPSWFKEDEEKHSKPMKPVTKEEMDLERQRFKEINAMPIRAVLEARFRKKRKVAQKMKQAKERADLITNNAELTPVEKTKELQKIYKQAKGEKPKTITTVAKKFKNAANVPKYINGAKVKVVDRRLKKDMRAEKSKKRKRN